MLPSESEESFVYAKGDCLSCTDAHINFALDRDVLSHAATFDMHLSHAA